MQWNDLTGLTALVTGASSGIGAGYARALSTRGADLVLVARSQDRLDEVAANCPGAATVIAADLSESGAPEALVAELERRSIAVDVLVNNAGFGAYGDLVAQDPDRVEQMATLNVVALTGLTARLLPPMVARGRGGVVNVASTAAFQPLPHMATYGATKAYVLSFTEALWVETRGTGVDVTAICPGPTETAFFDVAGEGAKVGAERTVEQVVQTTFDALRRGRPSAVDGFANAALAFASERLPTRAKLAVVDRLMGNG